VKSESRLRKPHPARAAITYLIAAAPVGSVSWRWRFTTTLALFGPGSVPFGLMLFLIENHTLFADYSVEWSVLPAAATGVAVVLARFRPFEAWVLVMVSYAATLLSATVDGWAPWPLTTTNLFAALVVLFALGRDRRPWIGVLAWVSYLLAGTFAVWASNAGILDPQPASEAIPTANIASDSLTLGTLLGALAFLVGVLIRIWRQGRARVAEEERVAESERHRRRLLEERTRIARELHDVVAHHMSVITVQASTAEYRLADLSEEARAEFRSISGQARESLAEMRRLLGVLRSEDEAGAREPQPGPVALQGLAESVDRAGTPVSLDVADLPEDLPETVALTVFRVVQEALSNVVRHAPGAPTTVEVAAGAGQVTVTVVNGRSPVMPESERVEEGTASGASGFGLVGMRERVALDGGTLETGPTADGGFRVRAVLPIEERPTVEESP
jgi:signal transduction histidine kinase